LLPLTETPRHNERHNEVEFLIEVDQGE